MILRKKIDGTCMQIEIVACTIYNLHRVMPPICTKKNTIFDVISTQDTHKVEAKHKASRDTKQIGERPTIALVIIFTHINDCQDTIVVTSVLVSCGLRQLF